ncbi:hypothetical protein [Pseudoalteromonas luteoviolacea]|uniref:Uncharacterized protein n=1 Tax=Pseudoalteromonas luteoviolacea S4060-1 TaxID=1365257 RepID=A0A167N0G9_9GAMM|nr:hypothetical protein [Pseudoalteromonas luteoviolacea]KZN67253.1 hypothetical protein N478_17680 [Pseudoalteromonas luteoviolacea S4060-1]
MDEIDKLIISESSDCEMDLYQIIYDIHFLHPEFTISKKYDIALSSIVKLAQSNAIEVVEQIYERNGSKVRVSSERALLAEELSESLKHPKFWDRVHNFSADTSIVVVATESGIAAIET